MTHQRATPEGEAVLRRIVAAHAGQRPPAPDLAPVLQRAFTRALRHASVPFEGLGLSPSSVTVTTSVPLDAALAALPAHGLVAVLEAEGGLRGMIALSHGAMDPLIEVQTTGRVEAADLPPRRVTAIDEALSRDFIDLTLAAFAREAAEGEGRDWPERMAYGSRVEARDRLTLLLPERAYHALTAEVALGETGARKGQIVLVLPRDAALADGKGGKLGTDAPKTPPGWEAGLRASLSEAPLLLDAVLMRLTLTLGEVEALSEGDILPFDRADLASVALETPDGTVVLSAALGQQGGRRALRVAAPDRPPSAPDKAALEGGDRPAADTPAPASASGGQPRAVAQVAKG
ncbi:FliM/FliN family flagellar motor switch protein [Maritalea mobilis]|uniref:FliM/FliN family flagellar motor switch protein n=1 Tax=Maritalea mobilis TaxID=483324 RepID=UPI001C956542|nr:FliM/FliN family flagellar motor switch protein [Maritalea mobilis]MBY6200760.1 FliM/FliN family flagellar motor switch protein [Maritalea mobilis]